MITLQEVERRLAEAGLKTKYWGRPEVRELQHVVMPDESVYHALHGHYEGGFALLVATDRRLLLVDKKPLYLNLLDMPYHTIAEVDYFSRLLNATASIRSLNKHLRFTSAQRAHLRKLISDVQGRVMELRAFPDLADQPQASSVAYTADPTTGQRLLLTEFDHARHFTPSTNLQRTTPLSIRRRVSRFYPSHL